MSQFLASCCFCRCRVVCTFSHAMSVDGTNIHLYTLLLSQTQHNCVEQTAFVFPLGPVQFSCRVQPKCGLQRTNCDATEHRRVCFLHETVRKCARTQYFYTKFKISILSGRVDSPPRPTLCGSQVYCEVYRQNLIIFCIRSCVYYCVCVVELMWSELSSVSPSRSGLFVLAIRLQVEIIDYHSEYLHSAQPKQPRYRLLYPSPFSYYYRMLRQLKLILCYLILRTHNHLRLVFKRPLFPDMTLHQAGTGSPTGPPMASLKNVFTGRMSFLPCNQQRQSSEGS